MPPMIDPEKCVWTDAMQEHYARMLAAVKAEK